MLNLFPAGSFAREVRPLAQAIGYPQVNFYDRPGRPPQVQDLNSLASGQDLVLCRGDSRGREHDYYSLKRSFDFPSLIHPSAQLLDKSSIHIGQGSIITAGCILTTNIELGPFNLINLHCSIGHDVSTGAFCSLMPGVRLSGGVQLGHAVYLGSNAVVLPNIRIGDYAIIGAGAVITKDVPAYCTVTGVPGKVVKRENWMRRV